MKQFRIINLEWNSWNGFVFDFIEIEYYLFDGELLGVNFSKDHFQLSLLFFTFDIKSPLL